MNTQALNDYRPYRSQRSALLEYFVEFPFNYHLTFNFNRVITREYAEQQLRFFTCKILRRLLGRNYYRRNTGNTFSYVAFPEIGHQSLNLHFHAVAYVDPSMARVFEHDAKEIWNRMIPSGRLFVQPLLTKDDRKKVFGYDAKDMRHECDYILSEELPCFSAEVSRGLQFAS